MKTRKFLAILLTLAMCLGMLPGMAWADDNTPPAPRPTVTPTPWDQEVTIYGPGGMQFVATPYPAASYRAMALTPAQIEYYSGWNVEYYVATNKAIPAVYVNEYQTDICAVTPVGAIGGGWMAAMRYTDWAAEEERELLQEFAAVWGFESLTQDTESFAQYGIDCGVVCLSTDLLEAGTTLTVKMRLVNPNDTDEYYDVVLDKYALKPYTITFNANGGTGSMDPVYAEGDIAYQLPENTFTKEGYEFAGWATSENGDKVYNDEGYIKKNSDITLYAKWNEIVPAESGDVRVYDENDAYVQGYSTVQGAIDAVPANSTGYTVKIMPGSFENGTVTIAETLTLNKSSASFTLDLGGTTLTRNMTDTTDKTPVVKAQSGTVEIKNGTISYDISSYSKSGDASYAAAISVSGTNNNGNYLGGDCALTLTEVRVQAVLPKSKVYSLIYAESGTLNIYNCDLLATVATGNSSNQYVIHATKHNSAKVSTFVSISGESSINASNYAKMSALYLVKGADAEVLGDKVTISSTDASNKYAVYCKGGGNGDASTCTIEGGKFLGRMACEGSIGGANELGVITASGGLYSRALSTSAYTSYNRITPAEGYEYVANTDLETSETYPYVVRAAVTNVAQVNGVDYPTLEEAITAADAEHPITLLADINVTAQVEVGKEITLDLAGHKIEYIGTDALPSGVIMVLRGGNLTVTDSSNPSAGKIKSGNNAYAAIALTKAGEPSTANATLTVNGGTLEGYYYGIVGNGSRHGTVINVTGGVLTGTNGAAIYHPQDGTLTISGGSLTGGETGIEVRSGELNVTGGTFTSTAAEYICNPNGSGTTTVGAAIAIAQHTTNKAISATINVPAADLVGVKGLSIRNPQNNAFDNVTVTSTTIPFAEIPEGYHWSQTGENQYSLVKITYVAQIGETKYETLAAAISHATSNDTIQLLADIANAGEINLPAGVTLDGAKATEGKYTISGNSSITMGDGATVTNVKFHDITDGVTKTKYSMKGGSLTAIYGSGSATVTNCEFKDTSWEAIQFTPVAGSVLTITGNTFKTESEDTGPVRYVHVESAKNVDFSVTVTGNKFYNGGRLNQTGLEIYYPTDADKVTLSGNYMAEPMAVCIGTGGTSYNNATAEAMPFMNEALDAEVAVVASILDANVGDFLYTTLAAAVAAAKDGDTITMLANCSGNGISVPQGKFGTSGLTVDFGGYTYTVDQDPLAGSPGTQSQAFQLLKDNKITFKNGTIYSEKARMLVQNYSNLTLDNMTLTLNNQSYTSAAYTLSNNNGSALIKDTTINANNANSFAFDVCRYSSYPSVYVEVKGNSTINGDVEVYASGSDAKDGFGLTLTSGTLNGDIVIDDSAAAAMEATPEKASVTKADTFNQAAPDGYKWVANGDGTSSLAKATYVAQVVGGAKYETLAAAINAATNGQTVTLLKDTNGGYDISGKSITLDLNDNTLTLGPSVGSTNTETSGIRVLAGAGLTIKNGNLYVSNIRNAKYEGNTEKPYAGYVKVALANYGTMVIEDVTMTQDASDSRLIWAVSNRGDLTIKGNTTIPNGTNSYTSDDNPTLTRAAINMTPYDYANVNATLTVNSAGVTVGDIVINDENNPKSDGYTQDRTISLNISAGQYGEIKQINTYDGVTVTKSITGGKYSSAPAEMYIATGFEAAENSDTVYPYKVDLKAAFESGTEQETTGSTNEVVEGNTTTTTTTDFGTVEAGAYVIQIETKVETIGEETQTTTEYKPVTTEVETETVVNNVVPTTDIEDQDTVAAAKEALETSITTNAAAATFKAALAQNETSTQEQVLQTKAAAKAIAKAAAEPTVNAAEIATVKIELKTELKSYELAQGSNDSIVSDKVTYDIKPVAVLYNSSDVKIGDAVELNNDDIQTGESYTFSIPVPSNMGVSAGEMIKVTHTDSKSNVETYLLPVKADSDKLYVEVTVSHFSTFELAKQSDGNFDDILFAKSISLQDSIACNYYVYLPVNGSYDANKVSVTSTFKGTATTMNGVACGLETISGTNYIPYRFVVADAAAKEMTEKISVVVKYDGMVIKTVDWSVRSYCEGLISDDNESVSHNIAKATLDYGADAQKYFNHKASDLATSGNNNTNYLSLAEFSEPTATVKSGSATGVSSTVSRSLVTTSKTQLNVYFNLDSNSYSDGYTITVKKGDAEINNDSYNVEWFPSSKQICVTITGIAAAELDDRYTVTIRNSDFAEGFSYTLSSLNYLFKNLDSAVVRDDGSGTLGNLCKAMFNYYYYAEEFFGGK